MNWKAILSAALFCFGSTALAGPLPKPLQDSDFPKFSEAEVELGRQLFWDKILSGNKNIACASCHHPRFGTSDGLSLGMGEGGIGLGKGRKADPNNPPEQRIPRNSPALWNNGAHQYSVLFADGRIEQDQNRASGSRTPLEDEMVKEFASILSAQAMFPVLSQDEMAGHYGESKVSKLVRQGRITSEDGAWAEIAKRVSEIPEYAKQFAVVYSEIAKGKPIGFTDISNAIAAFITVSFRSDQSPFDAYLREQKPMSQAAMRGLELFYGEASCDTCHSGPIFSDMKFHAMGDVQIGPGKAERFEKHQRDIGRMRVSNNPKDAYAFRTTPLRNVTLTAPYGHAGAITDLTAYVKHHINPKPNLAQYDLASATLPKMNTNKPDLNPDPVTGADFAAIAAHRIDYAPKLNDRQIADIVAFLHALEDPQAKQGGHLPIPDQVPSGLPVDR